MGGQYRSPLFYYLIHMALVLKTDFEGQYKVSFGRFSSGDLDIYIEKFTKHYLLSLFGKEFYDLFIADLTAGSATVAQIPQTQRFLDVYNEFYFDDATCYYDSKGIRQMLVKFIYFHYKRDELNFATVVGQVRNDNENSTGIGYNGFNLVEAYNEAVHDYKSIQYFMLRESSTYEEVLTDRIEEINGY